MEQASGVFEIFDRGKGSNVADAGRGSVALPGIDVMASAVGLPFVLGHIFRAEDLNLADHEASALLLVGGCMWLRGE